MSTLVSIRRQVIVISAHTKQKHTHNIQRKHHTHNIWGWNRSLYHWNFLWTVFCVLYVFVFVQYLFCCCCCCFWVRIYVNEAWIRSDICWACTVSSYSQNVGIGIGFVKIPQHACEIFIMMRKRDRIECSRHRADFHSRMPLARA